MSRSSRNRRKRSNRSAKIITIAFSIIIVTSVILGLLGPFVFQDSNDSAPPPTQVFPTAAPLPTLTMAPSATPTSGVPTPVMVTPTPEP